MKDAVDISIKTRLALPDIGTKLVKKLICVDTLCYLLLQRRFSSRSRT